MCDYSLHLVASRPAKIGDTLVTANFPRTMTRGFAAVGDSAVAVCLRPGSELAFDSPAEYGHALMEWLPFLRHVKKQAGRVARFRQINGHRHDTHHDALEFDDGTVVLLTRLCAGQRASVLQVPPELESKSLMIEPRHSDGAADLVLSQ